MDAFSGDYYRLLQLPRTASTQEIKSAFRRLARQYHPDLHPNQPEAAAKFQALREAYEVLSDRIRRQHYDERTAQSGYSSASFSEPSIDSKETYSRKHNPQHPKDFYIRGIRHALAHRYSAALADYSQAIALDPSFAEAYLRRAEVHHVLEHDSAVLADCQQSIALDPTEPKLYFYQGVARYRLGYVQSAIPAFNNAIARDPEEARYYHWRAIAAQDLGDIDEAVQDFRQAAQRYRRQGDRANEREIQQTLKALGTAGQRWPYRLLSQLVVFVLRPFSRFLGRLSGRFPGQWRASRPPGVSSSRTAHRPSGASFPNAAAADPPGVKGRASAHTKRASPPSASFQKPFRKPFQKQTYWAPGVSSRPVVQNNTSQHPMLGVMTSIKLLSNPAGELLPVYEQLPQGKRGVVGYGLAVLANLCFVFGATQYFASSSWLLASCLWASGGLMFVAMVLVISVVRVWMRIQGLWTADIFILGTAMVPLGLIAMTAGLMPALTKLLTAPWDHVVMAAVLITAVFWGFSQAVLALNNGLYHLHRFSGKTAAWLSTVILGLGIAAGVGTGYFLAAKVFLVRVATVGV